jgi:hypothetical protein
VNKNFFTSKNCLRKEDMRISETGILRKKNLISRYDVPNRKKSMKTSGLSRGQCQFFLSLHPTNTGNQLTFFKEFVLCMDSLSDQSLTVHGVTIKCRQNSSSIFSILNNYVKL